MESSLKNLATEAASIHLCLFSQSVEAASFRCSLFSSCRDCTVTFGKHQAMNCRDFRICSRTLWPLGGRKKALTSNTYTRSHEKIALWKRGRCLVPAVRTLGPSDDGDDWKHIIVSSDVTALKGMLLPSQVTQRPFPHHFSPVLNSRLRPLSFNYLPLLSAQLRPAGVRHSPEQRLWPQLLVPVSAQNCTK